jgi:hypothetical protein
MLSFDDTGDAPLDDFGGGTLVSGPTGTPTFTPTNTPVDSGAGWQKYTRDVPVAFADGDSFHVRALANGRVVIYRNGNLRAK